MAETLIRFTGDAPEYEPVGTGRRTRWWPGEVRYVDAAIATVLVRSAEGWEAESPSSALLAARLPAMGATEFAALVAASGLVANALYNVDGGLQQALTSNTYTSFNGASAAGAVAILPSGTSWDITVSSTPLWIRMPDGYTKVQVGAVTASEGLRVAPGDVHLGSDDGDDWLMTPVSRVYSGVGVWLRRSGSNDCTASIEFGT